ncbi:MAG: ATP-binding protein, partial [Solirubrobacteraceae bacterium]
MAGLPPDIEAAIGLGGETGRRIADLDWNRHPLGPISSWPPATRTAVAVALTSRFPIVLWLGGDLCVIYNDAYAAILGKKHPDAMGRSGRHVWKEIWDVIGPMLAGVVSTGVATWSDDLLLMLETAGEPEERYFTFTYSPLIAEDGAIEGVFCAVNETTDRVLSERRLEALRAIAVEVGDARTLDGAIAATISGCAAHRDSIPFAALYLSDEDEAIGSSTLVGATPNVAAQFMGPGFAVSQFLPGSEQAGQAWLVEDLEARFPGLRSALGAACPRRSICIRLYDPGEHRTMGWLLLGISRHVPFDRQYRDFCLLLADQVAQGLSAVLAYEHERDRARVLAELDHAKTEFFSNVSHEFRTPLTLMLGPLEDALAGAADDPLLAGQLQMAQRNGHRLLRLVNALLDFSRLQTGRAEANAVPTDVGAFTAEIAAEFSEACDGAGITLVIECEQQVAAIDRDMWETIVLNLLSNAFKFTLEGSITVSVRQGGEGVVRVTVNDTGVGIDGADLPHIFERFYRASGTGGRTMEGTGIGLALVKTLVEANGGTIGVQSGAQGTSIRIELPATDRAPDAIGRPGAGRSRAAAAFSAEA